MNVTVWSRRKNVAVMNSLDVARDVFNWLVTGPDPVSVDGRLFAGLPSRQLPLDEVRDHLMARRCTQATRDAVWAHLVLRSRTEGATWTVAAVGVALPALTSVTATLAARFPDDPADVAAEVIHGFLAALSTVDLRRPRIMLRLRWAAYRSGHKTLTEALASPTPVAPGFRSTPPHPPWGHPDLVLARAVANEVLTPTEADLIGTTRLENVALADWADRHQTPRWAAYKTRHRAEVRLLAYLRDEALDDDQSDSLIDRVATSIALSQPAATDRGTQLDTESSSRSVSVRRRTSARKVRCLMSKRDPESGVQKCGENPLVSRSPEDPRCA